MHEFTFDVDSPSGAVTWRGRDYGPRAVLVATPVRGDVPFATVFVPGHSGWSGRGRRSYVKAEFHVFRILEVVLDDRGEHNRPGATPSRRFRLKVEEVIDVEAGKKTPFDLNFSIAAIKARLDAGAPVKERKAHA